jgi:hypothetical protein
MVSWRILFAVQRADSYRYDGHDEDMGKST